MTSVCFDPLETSAASSSLIIVGFSFWNMYMKTSIIMSLPIASWEQNKSALTVPEMFLEGHFEGYIGLSES